MPDAPDLIDRARQTRVIVIGGGIAGLVAAFECAKVGMSVTLLEASSRLGGVVGSVDLDGVRADAVVDTFDGAAPELAALLTELDLAERLVPVAQTVPWVGHLRLPAEAMLGIPANSWDPAVRRIIGWRGVWRAYLDRLRPPLTIGHQRNLGALVRSRLGDRVCERMVAPITRARLGLEPEQVDAEIAAPGLVSALTRTGSLAGAVSALSPELPTRHTLTGGVALLASGLSERLALLEAEVRTDARVAEIRRTAGGWTVDVDEPADAAAGGDADADPAAEEVEADLLVVAVDESAARRLLSMIIDGADAPVPAGADVVTLRVTMPDTDRSDVAPAPFSPVRRVADVTAMLPWLAAEVPEGERIVRVTSVAVDEPDEAVIAAAQAAASAALGHELSSAHVLASVRTRAAWPPLAQIGRRQHQSDLRRTVHGMPGLALTGGWISDGEIADVVADAVAEASRLRRTVLWGDAGEAT